MKTDIIYLLQDFSNELSKEEILAAIEIPQNKEMGDYAIPCFSFAKKLHKSPAIIAKELKDYLENKEANEVISEVKNVGGYCNIFLDRAKVVERVLTKLSKPNFGIKLTGNGKTVCLDYSSPNIAKKFHVGHLRTTIIGNSLYKIYEKLGYKVFRFNHLGDWGTQFGALIVAYKKWSNEKAVSENGIDELLRIYVKYNNEEINNPVLKDQARAWFAKMEKNDTEAINIWNWFKQISMKEYKNIYELLNISFDYYYGESFYKDQVPVLANTLEAKGLLTDYEEAKVVNLDEIPHCMILKKDGCSTYQARDIAAAIYRKDNFEFDKCLYVTGLEQKLHFEQVFGVIEKMGYDWHGDLIHVPYGLVSYEGKKLSTRAGNIIYAKDILEEAIKRAYDAISEKNIEVASKEKVAKQVGIGAIIFHDLFNKRIHNCVFKWDEVLNFDGATGLYIQYTYARASSILRKVEACPNIEKMNSTLLVDDITYNLIRVLDQYEDVIKLAADNYEPSIIARYVFTLATEFNRFYHECNIINADEDTKNSRILVVDIFCQILKDGCNLLGMECPDQM